MLKLFKKYCVKYKFIFFLSVLSLIGCSETTGPEDQTYTERGVISRYESIGRLTSTEIRQLLIIANAPIPFELTYPVEIVSMNYHTIDGNGNPVIASGAVLIPQGTNNLSLVSIQHGTQTKGDLVASVSPLNSPEGMIGLVMASMGYFVVVPDYLGFGVSNVIHPYLHAESLVPCIIDLMRAARSYSSSNAISLNGNVFLTGYSEGGYTSLATQRKIELEYSQEFNLIAIAPMAGPYDLYGTVQAVFQRDYYSTPAYVAFLFTAYNEIYGWNRLTEIFNPPYSSRVQTLFNGSNTWNEILNQLPLSFTQLMNPTFVNNVLNGNELDVITALQENTLLDWTPRAPIRFIHGDADEIVPMQNAVTAMNALISSGAENVQLITIPGGTHESSGPEAAIIAIQWFESF